MGKAQEKVVEEKRGRRERLELFSREGKGREEVYSIWLKG